MSDLLVEYKLTIGTPNEETEVGMEKIRSQGLAKGCRYKMITV